MTDNELTFHKLEVAQSQSDVSADRTCDSSLGAWYESVRDTPIARFSCNDLCISCRQQVNVAAVMPVVISLLRDEPLAGVKYDGELFVAVTHIDRAYWSDHPLQLHEIMVVAKGLIPTADTDLRRDAENFVEFGTTSFSTI